MEESWSSSTIPFPPSIGLNLSHLWPLNFNQNIKLYKGKIGKKFGHQMEGID